MNIEKQIEFNLIKEKWKNFALTEYAKEKIENAQIIYSENELMRCQKDTTNAKEMLEKSGNPPIQNVSEIREILESARKAECLTPYQLCRIETILVALNRFRDYLTRGRAYENSLAYYDENISENEELYNEISSKIRNEQIDDYATKNLFEIRSQIINCDTKMRDNALDVMKKHKNCLAENFSTIKNGRVCIPVKKECRLQISGAVIDKSSTGNTLYIEPTSSAKYYDKLQLLKIEEENEEYCILYTLSAMVNEAYESIVSNIELMEKLDFVFSKGKLSIELDATEPYINTGRIIKLENAWHPLMERSIAVPLQFELGDETKGIVITGPNTGGKTVSIKTVMLNCIMAQCGLHVTCEKADICMNSRYLCDIGDGQNLSENLSTFSAHITNVLSVLNEVDANCFVIMDELGSGTDPTEGMGIAIAILEELRKSGALFLVTTHYPEVKEYAKRTDGIVNARMTFDKETLKPTYQMVIGEAGESCAFYIADKLGMPQSMLRIAVEAAYGKEAFDNYCFNSTQEFTHSSSIKIQKNKRVIANTALTQKYSIGDSVFILPDKKIGIVCEPINEKGMLRIQLKDRKIWINHKRVKLNVKAEQLYPEDYDFSILFETVENRKKLHDMERKFTDAVVTYEDDKA